MTHYLKPQDDKGVAKGMLRNHHWGVGIIIDFMKAKSVPQSLDKSMCPPPPKLVKCMLPIL